MKYEDLKMQYAGKHALIYGFGKSGKAAAEFLALKGALVSVVDQKTLATLPPGLKQVPIAPESLKNQHFLVLSPGIPRTDTFVQQAIALGIEILSEPELAFREIQTPVIAVTGSNGKTTTTTLIGEMLKTSGYHVFVGGNIGEPLLHAVTQPQWTAQPLDFIVAELSSYQLETITSLSPRVAVFTNLSGNHLDRYKTLQNYAQAKYRLRALCTGATTVVLNQDSDWAQNFRLGPAKEILDFPWKDLSAYPFDFSKVQVPGKHNIENFMAAAFAAKSVGAKVYAIQRVINDFRGIEHRIEFLGRKKDIAFYNDSKSTTVASTQTCLQSFSDHTVHLLMGGRDKGSDYLPLLDLLKSKCKSIQLYGEARTKIQAAFQTVKPPLPLEIHETLEQATRQAFALAKSGDNVVLSPACASQDQFRDFEHRGQIFKEIFQNL